MQESSIKQQYIESRMYKSTIYSRPVHTCKTIDHISIEMQRLQEWPWKEVQLELYAGTTPGAFGMGLRGMILVEETLEHLPP